MTEGSGCQVESRPRTIRRRPTTTAPPPRVSARGDISGQSIVEEIDSPAELSSRGAIPVRGNRDEAGRAMTETSERPAGNTRQRLIAAASRQFSQRPYSMVSLDDILSEAELTKGAMYFHFASKQALASAIVNDLTETNRAAVAELIGRKMSGLETVIDLVYLLAVQDTQNEVARAGVRLLDSLDTTELATTLWQSWIETVTALIRKAATEGDIVDHHDPEDIAKMLVALWVGIRRISELNQPEHHLDNLQKVWILALPSFTNPDRIDYFTQFIKRRHTLAVKKVSTETLSPDLQTTALSRA